MKLLSIITALLLSTSAFASNCPQLYPQGREIAVPETIELCNSFYVIRYNDTAKANIFSAEILQPSGHTAERLNNFHADARTQSKATPAMYDASGFDRGHMTPAGDAIDADTMSETFLMTNMTPQLPTVNRISWRMLEESVRNMAVAAKHPIHVVTFAVYSATPKFMKTVPIPSGYYKVVYLDTGIRAFYASNTDHAVVTETTVAAVETAIGYAIH
jgi:endonuclease G